jgi:hypothetical protein
MIDSRKLAKHLSDLSGTYVKVTSKRISRTGNRRYKVQWPVTRTEEQMRIIETEWNRMWALPEHPFEKPEKKLLNISSAWFSGSVKQK